MAQTTTTTKRVFVLGNPGGYGTDAGSTSN